MIRKAIGLFIVMIGTLLLLSNLEVINFDDWSQYLWPALLMLIGLVGMFERKRIDTFSLIITIVGVALLVSNIGLVERDILSIALWPTIVIIIGIKMVTHTHFMCKTPIGSSDQKYYTAIFGGVDDKNIDKNFERCEITSIFGGAKVDFRDTKLKGDKGYINVVSIFGGSEIILPREYKVTINGTPIFGGVDNKLLENNAEAKKEIVINYSVIFGGLEIKN